MPFLGVLFLFFVFAFPAYAVQPGASPLSYRSFKDSDHGHALRVHLIEVNLKDPRMIVGVALAHGKASGEERLRGMAERTNALAAINGSFFQGRHMASSVGLLMRDGEIIADSRHRRTSLGITSDRQFVIGIPKIQTGLLFPERNRFQAISGVNQPRRTHQTMVYTSRFGKRTGTNSWGREVVVEKNKIIGYGTGNTLIPRSGYVISAHGRSGREIQRMYPLGQRVILQAKASGEWTDVRTVITGAPHLVHQGRIHNTYFQEKLQASLKAPNSRSALGYTHNQKLLLINVFPEGKSRGGVTYTRLAQIMRRLGAVEAMGLDGGGSTSLYFQDKGIKHGPRPVTNALIITMTPRPLRIPGQKIPISRFCGFGGDC
ncbi:hypothetical protein COW36_15440 [bacterium (Candidatus Blackallbacteria) CG17_big_fil_post_rev_8_21_14_2_50_48_46]|uniref:Phosphodiester glycosidase domain-containing protein n=1 Tax=bacterium (Candidatus Blackallbacteria) CG17_big_fil_post_rev_8_21_14_2_50_48_46 TaxID=2014261 RepID=A0A2M7G258_9BACT|nr:MAG: hypothetical protein COW64_16410 [bacterium (Candidatus Blackallbacteria) CG18_big_fil_WC_8_21_14_2_50_49_26]PIW15862.1 MAG: hypothetical protein COW36_15440 [bacterium (Candidatus Blackallbacteria) CG17_big_fil_post_rev_8_21_14_2_50_48_46]PIW49431.1 MAG: hypothetical protein COW20_05930 [bacterium (Candidatus Blackallbacteria) CG13_big_fil_rev_8_21_14_2_50_49_14]